MKRSLEEPASEPRKSSRSSHTETENASSLKVVKKNRRDSEGQSGVATASSRTIKPVAASLTPAESYARQKASAKQWADEEFKSKVSVKKSPHKQAIVAPETKAESVAAVTRKTRKSVTASTIVPPPAARGVQAESGINKPTIVIKTPLIKIERPRPQQ